MVVDWVITVSLDVPTLASCHCCLRSERFRKPCLVLLDIDKGDRAARFAWICANSGCLEHGIELSI